VSCWSIRETKGLRNRHGTKTALRPFTWGKEIMRYLYLIGEKKGIAEDRQGKALYQGGEGLGERPFENSTLTPGRGASPAIAPCSCRRKKRGGTGALQGKLVEKDESVRLEKGKRTLVESPISLKLGIDLGNPPPKKKHSIRCRDQWYLGSMYTQREV